MGSDTWLKTTLGGMTRWSSGGTPSKKSECFWKGSIPWISASSMKTTRISDSELKITPKGLVSGSRLAPQGSFLLLVRGSALHKNIPMGKAERDVAFNQDVKAIIANKGLDPDYLYFWFLSKRDELLTMVEFTGIGAGKLETKSLQKMIMCLPSLKEQQSISAIGRALDDKIDLNRRMNETLEAMAQALFKSWFIDFDGCTEFEDSELGLIPKGWRVGKLKEIATNTRKSVKPKELTESVPYFGLEHMPRNSISLSQWGDSEKITSNKYGFEAGDFLFGKLRPYFHKVGIAPVDGICSTDILVIRPTEKVFYPLVMSIISSNHFVDYTTQLSNGAKMPRTNWKDMGKYEILIPDSDTCLKFKKLVNPLYKKIQENIFQSRSLTSLRDTLLPKLISGELRVYEAEKMVGEA